MSSVNDLFTACGILITRYFFIESPFLNSGSLLWLLKREFFHFSLLCRLICGLMKYLSKNLWAEIGSSYERWQLGAVVSIFYFILLGSQHILNNFLNNSVLVNWLGFRPTNTGFLLSIVLVVH